MDIAAQAGACSVVAVCGLAIEARIAAGPGVVTLCGTGPARLAARLEDLLADETRAWRGIISFGIAGGLDPALRPGACVIADAVVTPSGRIPADALWMCALRACLPLAIPGTLAGVDLPVTDAAAKARLWQSSCACAVDMESHLAALAAQRHGLRFAACRVVADPAHRSLPSSATAGMRDDGRIALMPVLRTLASDPGQLPALIRLAADAHAATRSLRAARAHTGAAFAAPAH